MYHSGVLEGAIVAHIANVELVLSGHLWHSSLEIMSYVIMFLLITREDTNLLNTTVQKSAENRIDNGRGQILTSGCLFPQLILFFFYNFCINPLPTPVSRSNCRWEAPLSLSCLRTFRFTSSGSCWKAVLVEAPVASFI